MSELSGESRWKKSSHSMGNGDCVEACSSGDAILVRDSRNKSGPVLSVSTASWTSLMERLKRA